MKAKSFTDSQFLKVTIRFREIEKLEERKNARKKYQDADS
jgi:hypothetical protein